MGLWIRTQDRERLLKVTEVFIDDNEIHADSQYCGLLGEYSTKERAIEVLDEIQNMLVPRYIIETSAYDESMEDNITALFNKENSYKVMPTDNMDMQVISANEIVYQMPKE